MVDDEQRKVLDSSKAHGTKSNISVLPPTRIRIHNGMVHLWTEAAKVVIDTCADLR